MDDNTEKELQEKDFIQESYPKDPLPMWIWATSFLFLITLLWGSFSWYYKKMDRQIEKSPFLQVNNREMLLFLWNFPQLMRHNVKERRNYLPAFEYIDKIGIAEGAADQYVVAPPELLFFYHTWDRLVRRESSPRAIPRIEFLEFLDYMPEWKPENWPAATKDYSEFIQGLQNEALNNLAIAPLSRLPMVVRMAFQGWKNYFLEGRYINQTKITFGEMAAFIQSHPHYARNYWRNVIAADYPDYLKTLTLGDYDANALIPNSEIAPFLRLAFYNSISE